MTSDRDHKRRRALIVLAVAGVATLAGAGAGFAQRALTNVPTVGRLTPLTTAPTTTIPTNPVAGVGTGGAPTAPRPTGIGSTGLGGGGGLAPTGVGGGSPTFTPTVPTTTPTTTIPGNTPSGGTQSTNVGANPSYTIDPRAPGGVGKSGDGERTSSGSNPNCSSYKSFEGFGGRPCTGKAGARTKRTTVVQTKSGGDTVQAQTQTQTRTKGAAKKGKGNPKGDAKGDAPVVAAADSVANEIVIEVAGSVTEAQAIALSQRFNLTRVESQNFPLIDATMFRWRIPQDGRSYETVSRQLMASGSVLSVQRNLRFVLQQAETAYDDPGQYAIGKLHLKEAHAVTRGQDVRIAVIDSGIDVAHPEFAGAIAGTYDALRSTEGPHTHGTGVAGAIVAKSRLLGSAPAARILAIRAFGATSSGAESTSFVLLKSLNYAVEQGAQIINMSFAGPKDPLLERGLAAAAKRGIILIAAAGNAGAKSPPLYPGADRNVIAVTATDSADKLFEASNRGAYLAVAAPGVDLLLPSPDEKYQVTSGTSFAAAYISGVAALIVERNPGVSPEVVRRILTDTARDLGAKGRDDQFGYGLANALGVVQAARPVTAGTTTRAIELPKPTR